MTGSRVAILSVPWCEPRPLVAPVLLAACLESHGIAARGIDFNISFVKHFSDKPYYAEMKNYLCMAHMFVPSFKRYIIKEVLSFIKRFIDDLVSEFGPTHIGLSIFTHESLDFGLLMSYVIRRYHPDIKIMAGGKGLETKHETRWIYDIWVDNHVADTVVVGDAETSVVEAVKNNASGLVRSAAQTKQNMDHVPLAKWEDYDLSAYQLEDFDTDNEPYLAITASKGCVRQCTFCDVAAFWPKYIFRDPIKVAQEMIFNYKKTGIRLFHFTDNLINGSITNFRIMNQHLATELPRTLKYVGYAIFRGKHQMPEDDFALAAEAGNIFWGVGVESGSERVRFDMQKKFTNDDLDWSVRMLYKYGITQNWLLMVGYPSETEQDFQETKSLLTRYVHLKDRITVQVTPTLMLNANTPLLQDQEIATRHGIAHNNTEVQFGNRFWTSTKYLDNDWPTRSRRWKELINHIEQQGFKFGYGQPNQKYKDEIENLDKIYHEQKTKIINIRQM